MSNPSAFLDAAEHFESIVKVYEKPGGRGYERLAAAALRAFALEPMAYICNRVIDTAPIFMDGGGHCHGAQAALDNEMCPYTPTALHAAPKVRT